MKVENGSTARDQRAENPTVFSSGRIQAWAARIGLRFGGDVRTAPARSRTREPMRWTANGDMTQDWLDWSDRQWREPAISRD